MPARRISPVDLAAEAVAGVLQRPGRVALTALGTMLGVGVFVAVIGLTATAGGQISRRFDALLATEVVVEDAAEATGTGVGDNPFPAEADGRVRAIDGVVDAGVLWTVDDTGRIPVTGAIPASGPVGRAMPIVAASPGLLGAVHPVMAQGRTFDRFHDDQHQRVVVLGSAAAEDLGVSALIDNPAVFINGVPFTVIGIVGDVSRQPDLLFSVVVPRQVAESLWGPPQSGRFAKMLVDTRVGAAKVVADQVAVALRPEAPDRFTVTPPPEPSSLRDQVSSDFSVLFYLLAAVSLVIGAVGIANTTMVAVLERVPEIGLRRALGANRRHITAQFLIESATIGTAGGLVGTSVGVVLVVVISILRRWTALLNPVPVLTAPLIGTLIGVLAGLYPALKASRIEPIEALRR